MSARAVILAPEGVSLSPREADLFRAADPWGFILFARNIDCPDQVLRLTQSLRECVGRDAPVLIDQEGGRVQRMGPPHWRAWTPPLEFVAGLPAGHRAEAMSLRYRLIADELRAVGIDVNCAPTLDIARPETHPFLRNRCYADTANEVARMGRAVVDGLTAGGVLPVIKHMPGHGRAQVDSHKDLPRVTAPRADILEDWAPFRALADAPLGMTAHIVFDALDPHLAATQSPTLVRSMREEIGFEGLLMTDDISMEALSGTVVDRARASLEAGVDVVLHCNGRFDEMEALAADIPHLSARAAHRAERALAHRTAPDPFDAGAAAQRLAALTLEAAHA